MALPNKAAPNFGFMQWAHLVFGRLDARFETGDANGMIAWALETFGMGLSIGTSFGASGIVLMDLALRIQPDIDIFYIDTGYFFPETHALIDQLQGHYQRSFRRVRPQLTKAEHTAEYGPELYRHEPDLCCHLRKVAPLETALADSTAWASAIRRDQASTRRQAPTITWNERYNVVKLAPLVAWAEEDIWAHIRQHRLPYNKLHDQNYPSIGCWPCTRAVQPGEDPRAGRWSGMTKVECGLHLAR